MLCSERSSWLLACIYIAHVVDNWTFLILNKNIYNIGCIILMILFLLLMLLYYYFSFACQVLSYFSTFHLL